MKSEQAIREKLERVREHREELEDNLFADESAFEKVDRWIEAIEWVLEVDDE